MPSQVYPFDNFRNVADIDPTLCFILSPFRPEFAGPRQVIEDVAMELNLNSVRADDIKTAGVIHSDIWDHIKRAAVIIADITDANPNVMLELGVASAIKEHFRVILMIRRDVSNAIPFDLGPFRHIRYEDSLVGFRELKIQIKDYLKQALSEDNMLTSIGVRMKEWDNANRHYSLLPYEDILCRLQGFARIKEAPQQILAYLLAGSIQNGTDLEWWAQTNRSNPYAAEVAAELLLGPWLRPQFRAAYALQFFSEELMEPIIAEICRISQIPIVLSLLKAIKQKKVVEFTQNEGSGQISESERYELLQNFTPPRRIQLFPLNRN
jgi:hypothetical protein